MRAFCLAAAFSLVASLTALAEDKPDVKKLYQAAALKQKEHALKGLEYQFQVEEKKAAALKQAKPLKKATEKPWSITGLADNLVYKFNGTAAQIKAEKANQEKRIEVLKEKKEKLEKLEGLTPEIDCNSLEVGSIGMPVAGEGPVQATIFQVLDENNVLMKWGSNDIYWLKINTKGMIDGRIMKMNVVVYASGTKQYKTVTGTKTVLVLEVVSEK